MELRILEQKLPFASTKSRIYTFCSINFRPNCLLGFNSGVGRAGFLLVRGLDNAITFLSSWIVTKISTDDFIYGMKHTCAFMLTFIPVTSRQEISRNSLLRQKCTNRKKNPTQFLSFTPSTENIFLQSVCWG